MTENRFDILVSKYLTGELSSGELYELEELISNNEYYQLKFQEYIKTNILVEETAINTDSTIAFKEFLNTVEKPKKFKLQTFFKYAVIFVGLMLSVAGLNSLTNFLDNTDPRTALVIPNEDIVLYQENGDSKKLEFDTSIEDQFEDIAELKVGEGELYGISQFKSPIRTANYTLKIPFGKKLSVVLSDGSKVYLNSGSTLTYPNTFKNARNRVVTLQGEGYFEVTKNKKKPFIVKTNNLNVRVLGTKFNVSAYNNDTSNSVTLVEGKVAVNTPKAHKNRTSKSLLLAPNEMVTIQTTSEKLSKKTVNDIDKHISWKNEEFVFKNDNFIDVSKKLERNFNVNIISNNSNLNNKEFTGKFNQQDIFEILDAFRVHTPFTYTVEGNNILLETK